MDFALAQRSGCQELLGSGPRRWGRHLAFVLWHSAPGFEAGRPVQLSALVPGLSGPVHPAFVVELAELVAALLGAVAVVLVLVLAVALLEPDPGPALVQVAAGPVGLVALAIAAVAVAFADARSAVDVAESFPSTS